MNSLLSSATFRGNKDLPPRGFNTAALQIWLNHHVYHSTTGVPSLHMTSQVDTLTPYTYCPVPINTTMNITEVECNCCTDSCTSCSYLVSNYSTILVHEVQEWMVQNKGGVLVLAAWAEELPEGKSCVLKCIHMLKYKFSYTDCIH